MFSCQGSSRCHSIEIARRTQWKCLCMCITSITSQRSISVSYVSKRLTLTCRYVHSLIRCCFLWTYQWLETECQISKWHTTCLSRMFSFTWCWSCHFQSRRPNIRNKSLAIVHGTADGKWIQSTHCFLFFFFLRCVSVSLRHLRRNIFFRFV
jgi:hypothetical protein